MDKNELILEEIAKLKARKEDAFKEKVRQHLADISTITAAIKNHQSALELAKKNLKELQFEELDTTIFA